VLVGPASSCQPYLLPRRQLCFYSPDLRALIEKTPSNTVTICLSGDNAAALEVLIAWMNYDPTVSCHQRGAVLANWIKVVDKSGVPIAFKVWTLGHRMGGPCLVLRDECMRYLYETYAAPSPGIEVLIILPSTVRHVFREASTKHELRHFVTACLIHTGLQETTKTGSPINWSDVLSRRPELRAALHKAWSNPMKEQEDTLLEMEMYMSAFGEISGDTSQASSNMRKADDVAWMRKDLREGNMVAGVQSLAKQASCCNLQVE
jgi:hypothetical protein